MLSHVQAEAGACIAGESGESMGYSVGMPTTIAANVAGRFSYVELAKSTELKKPAEMHDF